MSLNVTFYHIGFETCKIKEVGILELVAGRCKMIGNDQQFGVTTMVYEIKFTRLTPAADFSMESLEQQFQSKMELEQEIQKMLHGKMIICFSYHFSIPLLFASTHNI